MYNRVIQKVGHLVFFVQGGFVIKKWFFDIKRQYRNFRKLPQRLIYDCGSKKTLIHFGLRK